MLLSELIEYIYASIIAPAVRQIFAALNVLPPMSSP